MTTATNLVQAPLPRLYDAILADHFARRRQMAFVTGPRQVQAVLDMPYGDADCFERREPVVVPARTLLSQLL
jgi:hypothetical protein